MGQVLEQTELAPVSEDEARRLALHRAGIRAPVRGVRRERVQVRQRPRIVAWILRLLRPRKTQ